MLPISNLLVLLLLTVLFGLVFKTMIPIMDAMISISISNPPKEYGYIRVAGSIGFCVLMMVIFFGHLFESPSAGQIACFTLIFGSLYMLTLPVMPKAMLQQV